MTDKLLLGNGASIAVRDRFDYKSLYSKAIDSGRISRRLDKLFKHFKTQDFEYILRLLQETNAINRLLDIQEADTFGLYKALREALIQTIRDIHPEYEGGKWSCRILESVERQ